MAGKLCSPRDIITVLNTRHHTLYVVTNILLGYTVHLQTCLAVTEEELVF